MAIQTARWQGPWRRTMPVCTLVHVEAGLRSGDRSMPEEHNRIMTDHLSDVLCTTGPIASEQLRQEGVASSRILEVGDVMLDLALAAKLKVQNRGLKGWPTGDAPVMVTTLHRPATVDHPPLLQGALDAMAQWAEATGGTVVFPVHPRTQKVIDAQGMTMPPGLVNPGAIGLFGRAGSLVHGRCGVNRFRWPAKGSLVSRNPCCYPPRHH